MKRNIAIIFCMIFVVMVYGQSRKYVPSNENEKLLYETIDKTIWPNDVKKSIEEYSTKEIGWVGIIEDYTFDDSNEEYNTYTLYIKHHYYDWIEDFANETPILLSGDGEGYFVCFYYTRKDTDNNELQKNLIGQCVICYGQPYMLTEKGTIVIATDYTRIILKEYVNPNWIKYGREGLF